MKEASPNQLLDDGIVEIKVNDFDDDYSQQNIFTSTIRENTRRKPVSGVKRSSFNFEDSYNGYNTQGLEESFSALNASIRDQNAFKSKLKTNRNDLRTEHEYNPSEKQIWEFNQSIISDKVGNKLAFNRGSTQKDQQKEKEEQEQKSLKNHGFQMKPVEPVHIELKNSPKTQKSPNSGQFKAILRSTNYFLEKSNGDSVMVNGEMLRDLYDEFFKQELFIPLFKYQRFDQWNNAKDKFNPDLEAHRIFKVSLQKYIQYITIKYPSQFQQVFKVLEQIQRGKVATTREQAGFSFVNFDFNSIVESLKQYISQPKTEVLRKTLLSKIRVIQDVLKSVQGQADLLQQQKQRTQGKVDPKTIKTITQLHQQAQKMRKAVQNLWQEFGQVELLLNFEETQYYCSKKIQNSPQLKFKEIWRKYRDVIRVQKSHHTEKKLKSILI